MPTIRRDAEVFSVPDRLAVLALRDVVIFPHVTMPLLVGRPASLAAVDSAMPICTVAASSRESYSSRGRRVARRRFSSRDSPGSA
jgi:ATP-dependent Lon protease